MRKNTKISKKAFMEMLAHYLKVLDNEDIYETVTEKASNIYAEYVVDPEMDLEKAYAAFTNTSEGKIDLEAFKPMLVQVIEDVSGKRPEIEENGMVNIDGVNIDVDKLYLSYTDTDYKIEVFIEMVEGFSKNLDDLKKTIEKEWIRVRKRPEKRKLWHFIPGVLLGILASLNPEFGLSAMIVVLFSGLEIERNCVVFGSLISLIRWVMPYLV